MTRVRLSRGAAERLATIAGTQPPWRQSSSDLARLGPAASTAAISTVEPPDDELGRLGLVTSAGLHADLASALGTTWVRPGVLVDLDVSVRRSDGPLRAHSWQRLRDDRVVAMSTAGGDVEIGWFDRSDWAAELGRIISVDPDPDPDPDPGGTSPADTLVVGQRELVATGAAVRTGRHDLLDALGYDEQLRVLNAGCRGRLRAVVIGVARPRVGWVSWVLHADGWRELSAYRTDHREGLLSVARVTPSQLGDRVERLVKGVLS